MKAMKQRKIDCKKEERPLELEKQVILYAIGSRNKPIPSETHLQTMIFLASKACPELQKYFRFESKKDDESIITNKSNRKRHSKRVRK